jgi:hypothetical protein
MPKLARTLALAAMLAVMSLAPVTAVAETHATDHATSQDAEHPATVRRVTSAQQAAADTAHRRLLAQERSLTPTGAPAQLPNPMPPAEPGRQPGWLTPALAALVFLAPTAGVAVLVVRRANRRQGAGQTA